MRRLLLLCCFLPVGAATAQTNAAAPADKDTITVTQPVSNPADEAKGRAVLQQMLDALGGERWINRGDFTVEGHTSTFYKGQPTGVGVYRQFHHVLPDGKAEDRAELTKKRDIVQLWTENAGYEVTFKGAKPLPQEQQDEYFRRQHYTLDAIIRTWLPQKDLLVIYGGSSVIGRREAESVTLIDRNNDAVTIDVEKDNHLPMRRTFKARNDKYKDTDEDQEEYSDWHPTQQIPVPVVTTRYLNGDMVSQRFIEKIEFRPVEAALFSPTAPIGKHK